VKVPRYATSTTTAAILAAATSFSVTDASGVTNGATTATIIDASRASRSRAPSQVTPLRFRLRCARFAHAAGVTVEFPFPASVAGVTNTLSINNGTNTETSTPVLIEEGTPTNPVTRTRSTTTRRREPVRTWQPSTRYVLDHRLPAGFGFTTGAAVSFQSFTTAGVADNDGVTGTIAVVNGNTATLNVTVPKVRSGDTLEHLTVGAAPGQNAITLSGTTNYSVAGNPFIAVGDSLTIEPDAFYLTPETVTVTSVNNTTASLVSPRHSPTATPWRGGRWR